MPKSFSTFISISLISLIVFEETTALNAYASLMPSAKHVSFDTPSYEKLDQGSGPQTNDSNNKSDEPVSTNNNENSSDSVDANQAIGTKFSKVNDNSNHENTDSISVSTQPAKTAPNDSILNTDIVNQLKPLKLTDDVNSGTVVDNDSNVGESQNGVLKSTVCATGFVPRDPLATASTPSIPTSILGHKKKPKQTIIEQAKQVTAMPLPLIETSEETDKKIDTIIDSERQELSQLWEATLTRSPDIQFVIQKLMPSNNNGTHATTILMRMLSTAMFGAMGAVTMMSPSIGTYAASSMGGSMVMNLLQLQEGKNAKKAKLSQTEAIMLYNMIRANADRLVDCFRNYKKNLVSLDRANADLNDLQAMVSDTRSNQDSSKQVDNEYTLRKAKRDIDSLSEEVRRYRQSLVDLAGTEAVCKLDKQINDEQLALKDPVANTKDNVKTAQASSAL